MLNPNDFVGVSFWIMSAAMLAATYFSSWKEIGPLVSGKLHYQLPQWLPVSHVCTTSTCAVFG